MAKRARPEEGKRRGARLVTGVLVVALGLGGYAAYRIVSNKLNPPAQCTATLAGTGSVNLGLDQADSAATIVAVAQGRSLPKRASIVALATARQESKLKNIPYGDRDSVGLFQQRPSQGWGSVQQIEDPVYAAGSFYSALVKVNGWETLAVTVAAADVQHPLEEYRGLYAQWEPMATIIAGALTGAPGASMTCSAGTDAAKAPVQAVGSDGMTKRASDLGAALAYGYSGGTHASTSAAPPYTHSADGLTVSLQLSTASAAAQQGYATWAVARASTLGVDRVQYSDEVWTRASGKWAKAAAPLAGTVDITVLKGG